MKNEIRGVGRNARGPRPKVTAIACAVSGVFLSASGVPANAQPSEIEEVTVTGSHILRRDLTASSPISTVDVSAFENASTVSVESVLNRMPQFQPAASQFTSGIQTSIFATPGISALNLRGLGTNRSLVLFDGKRAQPANATLVVDTSTIPAAAISRVEVISGGASAAYGADAMAGVVNFILRRDFEGVSVDAQTSESFEGDGAETRVSALFGINAEGGRGNMMLGLEVANREEVMQADRDFYRDGWNDRGTLGTATFLHPDAYAPGNTQFLPLNLPSQAAVDSLFPQLPPGTVSPRSEFRFNPDGTAYIQARGGAGYTGPIADFDTDLPERGLYVGPNGQLNQHFTERRISMPLERRSMFGRAVYDVTDNISAFGQVTYGKVETEQYATYSPASSMWQATIPRHASNALPAGMTTLLDSRPNPSAPWPLFRALDYLGSITTEVVSDTYQLMAGVEGSLPNRDVTWEAYVSSGGTEQTGHFSNIASFQRYQYLLQQPDYGRGSFLVGNNYTMRCTTGLPVWRQGVSDDCLHAIEVRMKHISDVKQDIAEFTTQGRLAEMRAGELRFAAGATYRENSVTFDPDSTNDNTSVVDNPIGLNPSNDAAGAIDVAEIYGELLIPATQNLDLELGYRYSDYSTAGGEPTYKALFNYSVTERFGLRGGFQLAARAPNIAELFSGPTARVVIFAGGDPCAWNTQNTWGNQPSNPRRTEVQALCRAIIGNDTSAFDTGPAYPAFGCNEPGPNCHQRPTGFFNAEQEIVSGNDELGVEKGKTWTLGFVANGILGAENLRLTADFYMIEIEEAIAPLAAFTAYAKCFNADGVSNPTLAFNDPGGFCSLIHRHPVTGERDNVVAPYSNLGLVETSGLDLQVDWRKDFGPGSLFVNSNMTFLDEYKTQANPDSPLLDAAGTLDQGGQFDYRVSSTFGYDFERATVSLGWRYLPAVDDATKVQNPRSTLLGAEGYSLFDVYGNVRFGDNMQLRVGIDNLLDEQAEIVGANPRVNNNAVNTNPGFYDLLGRRAFVGFQMEF